MDFLFYPSGEGLETFQAIEAIRLRLACAYHWGFFLNINVIRLNYNSWEGI